MEELLAIGEGIPFERVTKSCGYIVGSLHDKPIAQAKEQEETAVNPVAEGGVTDEKGISGSRP